jgi:hypothetical protein
MNLLKRSQLIILMAAIVGTPWMLNSPTVVSASQTADTTQPVPTPTTTPKPCKPTPGSPFIDPFCSPIPPRPPQNDCKPAPGSPFIDPFCPKPAPTPK